ncbi:hypothetical protein QYE76_026882 [Lolium multiflorum]|uniref:F-box domain-containing protein n=1 Tax=Lolium multiflorum TaxID=4521 RepID=A0AAD8VY14_LOLMU|nr:hypothetical protein QYE76_026882 [Lolium multiflorum]
MAKSHRSPATGSATSTAKPSVSTMRKLKPEDRLSALPDDILVNILDRLNVRDTARTSILSRRWSHLSTELSRLIINAKDFVPEGVSATNISVDDLVQMNAVAVEATNSILTRRNPGEHTIRLLSTTFYLRDEIPISIGHAVGNAILTHNIEKAEITVLTEKECLQCTDDDMLNYGAQFVSFFNECPNAFTRLTRLCLENLSFVESDFISNILDTCKQLKYLGFINCNTENWITCQVEHAQLSELSFIECYFGKIELKWLPRLTRITFECWICFVELPLSLGHVPSLEVVSLINTALSWHGMVKLSTLLFGTYVRDLTLDFKCEKIWVQPECLTKRLESVFHRLSTVNLLSIPEGYDLTWTMFILEAAPFLKELYMTVIDHPCEMEMDKEKRVEGLFSEQKGVEWESPTPNFKHHHLTQLIIFCFECCMVSHVRCVMKAALNLKDVYLYSSLACKYCIHLGPRPSTFPFSIKKRASTKKLITQGMESHAKIHFLGSDKMSDYHTARIR